MAKLFSILGDSLSTLAGYNPEGFCRYYEGERGRALGVVQPHNTWWYQVIEHFDGTLLANSSFSGSLVEGDKFPAAGSAERVKALACEDVAPDVIIVFMGINDYGWGGVAGQASGRMVTDMPAFQTPGLASHDVAQRFEVAYDALLRRLREVYPQVEIWCCTLAPGRIKDSVFSTFTYNLRGIHFDQYNQAIRGSAQRSGCTLVDLRAQACDYESIDGTHPTARGMQQLASMFIAAREGGICEASSSEERCTKPSCIHCPSAVSTGNNWLLVCEER